jgi:hypothetical protein
MNSCNPLGYTPKRRPTILLWSVANAIIAMERAHYVARRGNE